MKKIDKIVKKILQEDNPPDIVDFKNAQGFLERGKTANKEEKGEDNGRNL